MGCCFSREEPEVQNRLIVEKRCHKCGYNFLSSIDYNKHIIECNKLNGDL